MKICFMSKYQGASDLWFFFMRLFSQCSAEMILFAKLKGMSKRWPFYSTFLRIMAQCAINKKLSFLSETVWKIKENTKGQGKKPHNLLEWFNFLINGKCSEIFYNERILWGGNVSMGLSKSKNAKKILSNNVSKTSVLMTFGHEWFGKTHSTHISDITVFTL